MTLAITRPTAPVQVAADTWLIPNIAPVFGADVYLPVNSLLILGKEPIIVDTGAPIHSEQWREQVFSLVDPADVRWIFLSHDDGDHMGNLHYALEHCPNATMVTNFFATERLALERPLPLERLRWLGPGESFDAGDRKLQLILPPIFDGPTTRGLFDKRTGVLWSVDSFAALTPGPVHTHGDMPSDLYDESFRQLNSLISPWHQWLDRVQYARHVDSVAGLDASAVASAHGPILTGNAIDDAFERVRAMAGTQRVVPADQSLLDELVSAAITSAATVPAQRTRRRWWSRS